MSTEATINGRTVDVATPVAAGPVLVTVGRQRTIPGPRESYRSQREHVSITVPCQKSGPAIESAHKWADRWVQSKLEEATQEAVEWLGEG